MLYRCIKCGQVVETPRDAFREYVLTLVAIVVMFLVVGLL